jgi:protein-S-isoprenylcysteine O-methyltransferase Ste14
MTLSRLRKVTWRLVFVYSLIVALVVFAEHDEKKYLRTWFWAGFALVVLGEWVRMWAAGHLVKNKVLTVTGPYAYVKNPLYIGTFFCMVGFAIMAKGHPGAVWWQAYMNWILLGIGVLGFVVYYVPYKKKREGSRLHDIFGEAWDHYDRAVPDYFPKLTRYERASNAPWSWAATCENSEQWTPLAIAAGTLAILFNKQLIDFVMSAVGKITG